MKKYSFLLPISLAALVVGCGGGELGDDVVQASDQRESQQGFVLLHVLWPQPAVIPVCWNNPSTQNATERQWVQRAVERTWMRSSRVAFTGWGECPGTVQNNAVRIQISDEQPHVQKHGSGLVYFREGVFLNFTFSRWGNVAPLNCNSNQTRRRHCIEVSAAHEFGHVLGFVHEQYRPDTPSKYKNEVNCGYIEYSSNGYATVGRWDIDSILNYCNPVWSNAGKLSRTDVEMVQSYYRAPLKDANFTFDADFYLSINPDVRAIVGFDQQAAQNHWNQFGLREGRRGSREFDPIFYINKYPDLRSFIGNDYIKARDHWVNHGIDEGRQGSREVSSVYYAQNNPGLPASALTNRRASLRHWSEYGLAEQRRASPEFSIAAYFSRYSDLRDAYRYTSSMTSFTNDAHLGFNHWVTTGFAQGRIGH